MSNLTSYQDWKQRIKAPIVEESNRFKKINEATKEELLAVKNIGPKSLKKILEARPISSLSSLKEAKLSAAAISALQSEFSV